MNKPKHQKNGNLSFRDEMLIPKRNGDIYFSVFEIENWLRRICLAACMIRYGVDWPSQIDPRIVGAVKRRLKRNKELFYLAAETDDNLIWATLHHELHALIFDPELWPTVEKLTAFGHERFANKLKEFSDIRNLLAHNRAFSEQTDTVFRGLEAAIKTGIENFKAEILYSEYDILNDNDRDPLNVAFQKQMVGNDWSRFQSFLGKNEFFYELVCLPARRPMNPAYISGYKLLAEYETYLNLVLAFTVNKTGDEYIVLLPRNVPLTRAVELTKVFTADPSVWTKKPFVTQDAKFILHPKIWFYENQRRIRE